MLPSSKVDINRKKNDVAFCGTGIFSPGKVDTIFEEDPAAIKKRHWSTRYQPHEHPIGANWQVLNNVRRSNSSTLHTISEATMGLNASRLLAINM
jgi:hypothetical protein